MSRFLASHELWKALASLDLTWQCSPGLVWEDPVVWGLGSQVSTTPTLPTASHLCPFTSPPGVTDVWVCSLEMIVCTQGCHSRGHLGG